MIALSAKYSSIKFSASVPSSEQRVMMNCLSLRHFLEAICLYSLKIFIASSSFWPKLDSVFVQLTNWFLHTALTTNLCYCCTQISSEDLRSPDTASVQVAEMQNGFLYYDPIPGDMVFTYESNPQVSVWKMWSLS